MEQIIILSIPMFLILLALEAWLSYKQKRDFYSLKDSLGNLGTGVVSQLIEIFTKTSMMLLYIWVYQNVDLTKFLWSSDFSSLHGISSWIIVFLLTDFIYYFFHRHSHEINLFWAAHMVHHSSEEYNFSVALRQSSFSGVLNWIYALSLALIGVPSEMFFTCYGLNLIYQFFIHTRFVKKLGWLEKIFNTPSHHRVHHARQGKYLDSNYAGVFIIWDKLFGTFIEEDEEPKYGIYPRFQSYDPIRANLMPLEELLDYFFKARSSDRWKVLFKGPLWLYENFKKGKNLNIMARAIPADEVSIILFVMALLIGVIVLFVPSLDWFSKTVLILISFGLFKAMGLRLDNRS